MPSIVEYKKIQAARGKYSHFQVEPGVSQRSFVNPMFSQVKTHSVAAATTDAYDLDYARA